VDTRAERAVIGPATAPDLTRVIARSFVTVRPGVKKTTGSHDMTAGRAARRRELLVRQAR
jgi:hypothetical protein